MNESVIQYINNKKNMKIKQDYLFEISLSKKSYSTKPSSEDYKRMKFHKEVVDTNMFMGYIR